jgi:hypothetical protein
MSLLVNIMEWHIYKRNLMKKRRCRLRESKYFFIWITVHKKANGKQVWHLVGVAIGESGLAS